MQIPYIEKSNGNIKAKQGDFEGSMKHYAKSLLGLKYLKEGRQIKEELLKQYEKEVEIPVNLNMALCNINVKNYQYAIHHASVVIELDPLNCKALYRRGLAFHHSAEV